uniref:Cytochrome c oxidase subunit 3 n=1 Tax=Pseudogarypus banksi TaxID=1131925 RepID=H9MFI7_9ARAC|nr:cytochrome c oxidase subunit 3 [Pseudogarypus banksi]
MTKFYHPFHMVSNSPWPLIISMETPLLLLGILLYFHMKYPLILLMSLILIISSSYQWWRDVSLEASYIGEYSSFSIYNLKIGVLMFIISEVMFFLSFFWGLFHMKLAPPFMGGALWPPFMVIPFNPVDIPLLNTLILLTSGLTATLAHFFLKMNKKKFMTFIFLSIILGLYFTTLQSWEYFNAKFTITDSVYGSIFFTATGFHGLHVILGSSFLMIILYRSYIFHTNKIYHIGFEASLWYWHFVDVVWLFLFTFLYI